MGQVLLIVWRESVEALLVIGILHAWLKLGNRTARRGLAYLWGGVVAGALAALTLAWALVSLGGWLSGDAQTCFQIIMLLVGAILIVQMVFWMRRHGRTLKQEIRTSLSNSDTTGHWWGVFVLALSAVAREGSEMAVFVYGISTSQHMTAATICISVVIGFGLAYATFHLVQAGGKLISWQRFFQVTEIILLLMAAGLCISGIERLLDILLENSDWLFSSEWAMALTEQAWDTSAFISDSSGWGNFWATLVGYRAQPTLCNVLTLAVYWLIVGLLMWRMAWLTRQQAS